MPIPYREPETYRSLEELCKSDPLNKIVMVNARVVGAEKKSTFFCSFLDHFQYPSRLQIAYVSRVRWSSSSPHANGRLCVGGKLDIRQVAFGLVGLIFGAAIIFVAGLQVGQNLDLLSLVKGEEASVEAPTPVKREAKGSAEAEPTKFTFYQNLDARAPELKRRKIKMPSGNANKVASVTRKVKHKKVKAPARERRVARSLKRNTRSGRNVLDQIAQGGAPRVAAASKSNATRRVVKVMEKVANNPPELPAREAKRTVPAVVAQKASGPSRFTLHVGAFPTFDQASKLVKKLRGQGHRAHVVLSSGSYSVRSGRFPDKDAARTFMTRLRSAGVQPRIVSL